MPKAAALVTGASSGIGLATVHRLLVDGYEVAACGRSRERLRSALGDGAANKCILIEADLSTPEGPAALAAQALEWLGERQLRILVNNAGAGAFGQTLANASVALFDELMTLNVRSPWILTQALLPRLARDSVVVNISSITGQRPFAGLGPYCASKAALDMFTQTWALELAPKGVRVVGVAPATIETGFAERAGMPHEAAAAFYSQPEKAASAHPIGRVGRPEEIAEAVSWLSSDRCTFITGATLLVDGGRMLTSATPPFTTAPAPAPAPAPPTPAPAPAPAADTE